MTTRKLNEQIAFLRRQKGFTQEELAKALGVTNQAVSKWETAQCCPDIQLLPAIAEVFDVSIDELFGCKTASTTTETTDIVFDLGNKINSLPQGEDADFTFKVTAALHVILFMKSETSVSSTNPGWDTEDAIEHAGNAEWGYSCFRVPEFTTVMRKGTVMFSNNSGLDLNLMKDDIRRIASVMKDFADYDTLSIASAIYTLTVHDENAYATLECISEKCGVSVDKTTALLDGPLSSYIIEKDSAYRFKGLYMTLLPLISLFDLR